jgi:hypothetical protein
VGENDALRSNAWKIFFKARVVQVETYLAIIGVAFRDQDVDIVPRLDELIYSFSIAGICEHLAALRMACRSDELL